MINTHVQQYYKDLSLYLLSVLVETLKWHYTVSYLWSVFIASSVAGVQPNWMARSLMVMFVERSNILSKAFKPLAYTFLFTPDNFKPSSWIKLIESYHDVFSFQLAFSVEISYCMVFWWRHFDLCTFGI